MLRTRLIDPTAPTVHLAVRAPASKAQRVDIAHDAAVVAQPEHLRRLRRRVAVRGEPLVGRERLDVGVEVAGVGVEVAGVGDVAAHARDRGAAPPTGARKQRSLVGMCQSFSAPTASDLTVPERPCAILLNSPARAMADGRHRHRRGGRKFGGAPWFTSAEPPQALAPERQRR
jgi:hypothetical protein